MQQLQSALSRDVHKPIKHWHERYKKLREEVNVDLEAVRKRFDASTVDLTRAKVRTCSASHVSATCEACSARMRCLESGVGH